MTNDTAYAITAFTPDWADAPEQWAEAARAWREVEHSIGRARLNIAYGSHDRQRFDLFLPAGRAEGVLVFVHGGYWRAFDRKSWSHFAAGAQVRGWAVAMPSYRLTPEVGIAEITGDLRDALVKIAGMTRGPIALAGHSAGGHLVARMVQADVALPPEVAERIVRVVPISPVADLRPLVDTEMNDDFRMDMAAATAESPALHPQTRAAEVTVWVGAEERPVFLDQARWLAEAWGAKLCHDPGRHHFDILDGLEVADSPLMQAILGPVQAP